MTDREIDKLLKKTLAPVEPSADLNRNLIRKMEDRRMKHFKISKKKTIGLAAACCLLIGTVSVASSGIVSSVIGGSGYPEYVSYSQLGKAQSKAGFTGNVPENFANGYSFQRMNVGHNKNLDENGNTLASYRELMVEYEKAGADDLSLYLEESQYVPKDTSGRTPNAQTTINGITVSYYVDTYKWVPVGYELTPEDEANKQRNDYFISEGADEVSENQVSGVTWEQDGIHYHLLNIKNATPAETMFGMAQEIIEFE